MSKYYPPEYKASRFHCLHCQTYAHQRWSTMYTRERNGERGVYSKQGDIFVYNPVYIEGEPMEVSLCAHCNAPTLWVSEKIIFPITGAAPPVNSDLPDSVKKIYSEAVNIANQSSRAACALLRYAIELLLKHLGETGTINDAIKNLVKKGLDQRIQKSLDIVRVTGNNAVHPGEIVFDDTTNVHTLFHLINIIADVLITQPKQIQEAYDNLPEDARKAIEKRDS